MIIYQLLDYFSLTLMLAMRLRLQCWHLFYGDDDDGGGVSSYS